VNLSIMKFLAFEQVLITPLPAFFRCIFFGVQIRFLVCT
jgi:hypothetical protein